MWEKGDTHKWTQSKPPSSSSAVAFWYCWYSDLRSFMLDSASSIPSPVHQWRKGFLLNMAVNWLHLFSTPPGWWCCSQWRWWPSSFLRGECHKWKPSHCWGSTPKSRRSSCSPHWASTHPHTCCTSFKYTSTSQIYSVSGVCSTHHVLGKDLGLSWSLKDNYFWVWWLPSPMHSLCGWFDS